MYRWLLILTLSFLSPALAGSVLRDEWDGPYSAATTIDVNAGHTPETFLRAAWWQIRGEEIEPELSAEWSKRLRDEGRLRRIDVVHALCKIAGREDVPLSYSDPWVGRFDPPTPSTPKRGTRDIGAVLMFFFNCPGGVNCGMEWANNHVRGMETPSPDLAFGTNAAGFYDPKQPGFWVRELTDAKAAGLRFLLPNVYGPDLLHGQLEALQAALESLADPVQLGMFDDTWTWGEPWFDAFWVNKPDLHEPDAAATKLYEAKWLPYFRALPRKHWYLVKGRPLIYFYNGGKLYPRDRMAAVLSRMKLRFETDFGVAPFLAVDSAFFDDPEMPSVADARFTWYTFDLPGGRSRFTLNGVVLDHAMVRWDSTGRDKSDAAGERIAKGPELLQNALDDSRDADLLVLATWNDLGEGTGINRAYDYWYKGQWLSPTYFMDLVRDTQVPAQP